MSVSSAGLAFVIRLSIAIRETLSMPLILVLHEVARIGKKNQQSSDNRVTER
jgi:hypothetical protein